jgi:alkylated DNA nucleotide flippase Atl1
VLDLVDRIPPGRVMTYGDVAEALGTRAPRLVGQVLSRHGHDVPWQRVVLATGDPAPVLAGEALSLLREEGCPLTDDGRRVDLHRARWSAPLPDLG